MAVEKTLCILKPDAVRDRKVGRVIDRIEASGLVIERMEMCELARPLVEEHYAHLAAEPFFGRVVDFMTSGPVVKMVLSGPNAVAKLRALMGATDPLQAVPGTIRADYALETSSNIIHGSDSSKSAAEEIKRFFC